jgi:hypothetical protein
MGARRFGVVRAHDTLVLEVPNRGSGNYREGGYGTDGFSLAMNDWSGTRQNWQFRAARSRQNRHLKSAQSRRYRTARRSR